MKKYFRALFCFIYTIIKFTFIKIFNFKYFKYKMINVCSPFTEIDIRKGYLTIGNKFKMRTNCHLRVRKNGELTLGDNVSLNYGDIIVCHKKIKIGNGCQFAPNVLIYDHDHDYKSEGGISDMNYISEPIEIGNNVWIGANSVILRGSKIGDNCVIAAGSVIKGVVPSNTTLVQKKQTTLIKNN